MNVAELRAELSKYPDDMEVMFNDDEAGPSSFYSAHVELFPWWSSKIARHMKSLGVTQVEVLVLG